MYESYCPKNDLCLTNKNICSKIGCTELEEIHIMDDKKEEYKGKIIETINKIEDIETLIYLDTFIKEMVKAEN